jgi:hypothetical protein
MPAQTIKISGARQHNELDRTEPIRLKKGERHTIEAVVDRLVVHE